jgi:transcriptional regulator GlxA family with amidase domain
MVVPPHRDGGQAQFIDRPMPECGSQPMEELLRWMVENLDEEHPVHELAARVHMSPRTFARRFRADTSPQSYRRAFRGQMAPAG